MRHIPCLRKNIVFVSQLAYSDFVTIFIGDAWKVAKWDMIMVREKLQYILYLIKFVLDLIAMVESVIDAYLWLQRFSHMTKKWMKVVLSKDKLSNLKYMNLEFCEDYVFDK